MTEFQKRHFEFLAETLRECGASNELIHRFAGALNGARFKEWCGFNAELANAQEFLDEIDRCVNEHGLRT